MNSIDIFHPAIKKWFTGNIGNPTDIQNSAWPVIAENKHVLISAPTGSGKTLAAFLWGINQLATGAWPAGKVRMLYISPMKALNNDVKRNLLQPLSGIEEIFCEEGIPFPAINVLTRSGDTPVDERRRMIRRQPEILITTPESLNILLTSDSGRALFTGISAVILDEIHAVAGTKRGTHLITAVERLVRLSGEFQRIGLSATARPLETVAAFIVGFEREGKPRSVSILSSAIAKKYEIKVRFPSNADASGPNDKETWWPSLISDFKEIIKKHKSTLFFTNSRRMAEKITRLINEGEDTELAYSHHGSLSREIRLAVEEKLKRGELKAIIATSSLELGIDIGSLDRVVLVETPGTVSSAMQRVGRSGHDVGDTSSGTIFPLHGLDFLNAAVVAKSILSHEIEEIHPVEAPLDVLSQIILSMTVSEQWDTDDLYNFLLTSYPYRSLKRAHFDLVLDMLAGRFADTRIRELRPRIHLDRLDNTVNAYSGSSFLLYLSGGTIPDRGYFNMRVQGSNAKIGELDEEFVWERRIGETFSLGTQLWRIQKITHNDVEVIVSHDRLNIVPFWKADGENTDFYLSEKISAFLEEADSSLDDPEFIKRLTDDFCMEERAAAALIDFLKLQQKHTSCLPHRHRLVVEHFDDPMNQSGKKQVIIHTFWGGKINMTFAFALARAWEKTNHYPLQVIHTNEAVMLILPNEFHATEIFTMLTADNIEELLLQGLEDTGFFGSRFRENAERALLLPRSSFGKRMPLWLNRLRSKKLLEAVRKYREFPVILETWRSCIEDELDIADLKNLLDEISTGSISVYEAVTHTASPFASGLIWKETNKYMYEDDTPHGKAGQAGSLILEMMHGGRLRPRIPEKLMKELDAKLKRTALGYAPASAHELLDWIKERLLIPLNEWEDIAAAIERDYPGESGGFLQEIENKITRIKLPGAGEMISSIEMLPKIIQAFPDLDKKYSSGIKHEQKNDDSWTPADFLAGWLAYYSPVKTETVRTLLGISNSVFTQAMLELTEDRKAIIDCFGELSTDEEICLTENLEILLRMLRKSRRQEFEPLPAEKLGLFFAVFQGIVHKGNGIEDLQQRLEQLFGWPAPASAWEEYLLPSRMSPYFTAWLDSLMQTSDLTWSGCGKEKLTLSFLQDIELFHLPEHKDADDTASLLPDPHGRFSFFDIVKNSGLSFNETAEKIWHLAWKGKIASDTFNTIRMGILNRFSAEESLSAKAKPGRVSGMNRWQASKPVQGYWYRISVPEKKDILEQEDIVKDRVRQLLKRYGILFRELLMHELPMLQWKNIFKSLRLLEFSGEVLTGHFFESIGVQFISREAFRILQQPLPEDKIYWLNAADPASLCGLQIESLKNKYPSRLSGTFMVFEGSRIIIVSKRMGKNLEINTEPDHPKLREYLAVFRDLAGREFNPESRITVEKINGLPASSCPYTDALRNAGFRSSGIAMELWI